MKSTFGAPGFGRTGFGQAGSDSPMVRPMRPGNVVPGRYSLSWACAEAGRPVAAKVDAASKDVPLSSKSRRLITRPALDFLSGCSLLMTILRFRTTHGSVAHRLSECYLALEFFDFAARGGCDGFEIDCHLLDLAGECVRRFIVSADRGARIHADIKGFVGRKST